MKISYSIARFLEIKGATMFGLTFMAKEKEGIVMH